jgi:hypothetical protein
MPGSAQHSSLHGVNTALVGVRLVQRATEGVPLLDPVRSLTKTLNQVLEHARVSACLVDRICD